MGGGALDQQDTAQASSDNLLTAVMGVGMKITNMRGPVALHPLAKATSLLADGSEIFGDPSTQTR
jgi:hypothetical protein